MYVLIWYKATAIYSLRESCGMRWHQQNTIGANYTDKDAAAAQGICQGCALGSAHQYPTNQHYVKSTVAHDPGQ